MPGNSLGERILRTVLIVFGPLMLSLAAFELFPSLSEGAAKMMVLVSGAWLMSSLILTPALLSDGLDSSSGPPDSDGGGGKGPEQPPVPPDAPHEGIPLPDAEQASERVRDHVRSRRVRLRRPVREPERTPAPTPPDA